MKPSEIVGAFVNEFGECQIFFKYDFSTEVCKRNDKDALKCTVTFIPYITDETRKHAPNTECTFKGRTTHQFFDVDKSPIYEINGTYCNYLKQRLDLDATVEEIYAALVYGMSPLGTLTFCRTHTREKFIESAINDSEDFGYSEFFDWALALKLPAHNGQQKVSMLFGREKFLPTQ